MAFDVTMRITELFFDRPGVMDAVAKAKKKNLGHMGGYVRKTARNLIGRPKRAVSLPGQPPNAHSKDKIATIRNILYAYDPGTGTVVVGPVRLNQVDYNAAIRPVKGGVPALLEKGGVVVIREWQLASGEWVRADQRFTRRLAVTRQRYRRAQVAARPFMLPAGRLAGEKFPEFWRDTIVP